MSSPSNELEIISRGSIEMVSTTKQGTDLLQTDDMDQSTLEQLPPQSPRSVPAEREKAEEAEKEVEEEEEEEINLEKYVVEQEERAADEVESMFEATIPFCLEEATHELAQSRQQTENLLQRIELLSGRIRCGLNMVEDTGTTLPTIPDPVATSSRSNTDDIMVTSSSNKNKHTMRSDGAGGGLDEVEVGRERGVVSEDSGSEEKMDPKLAKALERMRRLDRRLANLLTREREVKEHRQKQFELHMSSSGVEEELSPSSSFSLLPVFPTQVQEENIVNSHSSNTTTQLSHKTDFIKKNIEEAGAPLIMTESEKLRLEQLLAQDDDNTEMEEGSISGACSTESNFFRLSEESRSALGYIDMQLQALGSEGHRAKEQDLRPSVREYDEQQGVVVSPCSGEGAGRSRERLREIDEKLAQLKDSSLYHHLLQHREHQEHLHHHLQHQEHQ